LFEAFMNSTTLTSYYKVIFKRLTMRIIIYMIKRRDNDHRKVTEMRYRYRFNSKES